VDSAPNNGTYTFDPAGTPFTASAWTIVANGGGSGSTDITVRLADSNQQGALLIHRNNTPGAREADLIHFACNMHFSHVSPADWYYGYVEYMFCHGVISGYSDGTFRPNNLVTRGQLAKMIN